MSEKTVIVNEADVPGVWPGENEVEFDEETGKIRVLEGPDAGVETIPNERVVDAIGRASQGEVENDAAERSAVE